MIVHFEFFTNEMECERGKEYFGNKVIVLNATSFLVLQYKNARKTSFKIYYTMGTISITTKANLRKKSLICSP